MPPLTETTSGGLNHADFVGTYTGCRQSEVILVFMVSGMAMAIRNLALPWVFLGRTYNTSNIAYWTKYLIDVCFILGTPLLSFSIFAEHLFAFFLVLAIVLLILLLAVFLESYESIGTPLRQAWNRIMDEQMKPTTFVTYMRAIMMSCVSVAILAVDFPVFPRKFTKTEQFGHSVMDVGVSSFIFISAIGSRMAKMQSAERKRSSTHSKWYKSSTTFLFALGFARAIVLEFIGYPQHVSEYGVHWNFFFTMAFVRVAYNFLPKQFPLLTSFVFGICHQTLLKSGYQEWILVDGKNDRANLVAANAEGVFSLMGYLTIFYASLAVGDFIAGTSIRVKSWVRRCFQLVILGFLAFFCQHLCELWIDPPSRRVVNLTYIFSQMVLMLLSTVVVLTIQMFSIVAWAAAFPQFSRGDDPFSSVSPCLADSINRHSLAFFVISNLLTGIVNMSINTHESSDSTAIIVLSIYSLIISFVVHYSSYRNVTFKVKVT